MQQHSGTAGRGSWRQQWRHHHLSKTEASSKTHFQQQWPPGGVPVLPLFPAASSSQLGCAGTAITSGPTVTKFCCMCSCPCRLPLPWSLPQRLECGWQLCQGTCNSSSSSHISVNCVYMPRFATHSAGLPDEPHGQAVQQHVKHCVILLHVKHCVILQQASSSSCPSRAAAHQRSWLMTSTLPAKLTMASSRHLAQASRARQT